MLKNFSKDLNVVLISALTGGLAMTWLAPIIIKLLFTPPVSFGTNCEPAADWSMQKLAVSQLGGVILGGVLGSVALVFWARRSERKASGGGASALPVVQQPKP
jgi:hypothetical protein